MPKVLFGVTIPLTANAFLRDQLTELAKQGWEVHLVTSPGEGFERLNELTNVHLHSIAMKRAPSFISDCKSLIKWMGLIKEIKPDLVVASTPKAGLLGMIAAHIRRTPTRLYHVRGLRAEGLSGAVAKISLLSEKFAASASTHVLCDSQSLLNKMHELGLVKPNKGTVLGSGSCCGVDIERFRLPTNDERASSRASLGLTEEDIVVGFVGRLAVDKGIQELAEATRNAHELNEKLKLVLVGPVEEEDAGSLTHTLKDLAEAPWVTLTGPVTDARTAYWAFDLFCSPSYREGFPIATLEAQACGIAVITTRATGCADSIEPDLTGLLVDSHASSSLQAAIQTLVQDDSKRKAMGSAARERASHDFNMPMVQARFIDYLDQIALTSTSI